MIKGTHTGANKTLNTINHAQAVRYAVISGTPKRIISIAFSATHSAVVRCPFIAVNLP